MRHLSRGGPNLGFNQARLGPFGTAKCSTIRRQNGAPHRDKRSIFLDEMHLLRPHHQRTDRACHPPRRRPAALGAEGRRVAVQ
jgi:hypothetical protein